MIEVSIQGGQVLPWRATWRFWRRADASRRWRAVRRRRSVYAFSANLRTLTTLAQHALKSPTRKTRDALHVAIQHHR